MTNTVTDTEMAHNQQLWYLGRGAWSKSRN